MRGKTYHMVRGKRTVNSTGLGVLAANLPRSLFEVELRGRGVRRGIEEGASHCYPLGIHRPILGKMWDLSREAQYCSQPLQTVLRQPRARCEGEKLGGGELEDVVQEVKGLTAMYSEDLETMAIMARRKVDVR